MNEVCGGTESWLLHTHTHTDTHTHRHTHTHTCAHTCAHTHTHTHTHIYTRTYTHMHTQASSGAAASDYEGALEAAAKETDAFQKSMEDSGSMIASPLGALFFTAVAGLVALPALLL